MTPIRVEEMQQDWSTLDRLAQAGPVIVTRNGMPLFVVQEATPELLEAWAEEMDVAGDMLLDDYVKTNGLMMDSDAYRKEFPEDALYTFPLEDTAA
jgi:hypothetical protein